MQLQVTDNRYIIEIPEGAELPLHPAGMWVRAMALLVDWLIKAGIMFVLAIVLSFAGGAGGGVFLILYFLLEWFYPVLFEVFKRGQTPGKKAYQICVVSADGTALTFGSSLLRNLLRVVDFMPFFYVVGAISTILNRRFQRIGDLAAGTIVVYVPEKLRRPEIEPGKTTPTPESITTEEQRSIVDFVERSEYLSEARQQELASVLQPLIQNKNPVDELRKMARFIVEN